ncbi:DUF2919 family protein [Enterobacter pseudoroggenkampii]|uniref:DUF2919 family protein n=1 Tax=Enterobacter pseudoroggenkampii TaxID=2996112 RepID=UPI0025B0C834|nr:DUF2919 family protein [Enterobacter pseudoroggenkampii]WJW96592.1 DUF2919 family protein [Enterobacter pseudoroggenkampii]
MRPYYTPEDYNADRELTLPLYCWLLMLIQGKAWVILFISSYIGMGNTGDVISILWPNPAGFYAGLVAGVPSLLTAFLYYYRTRVSFAWKACYYSLLAGSAVSMLITGIMWLKDNGMDNELVVILLIPDILCLMMYIFNQRLIDVFFPETIPVTGNNHV